jgi:hypothetical protein
VNAATLHTGFASYAITDLGQANAYGMNNLGQVLVAQNGVGWVWDNGQMTLDRRQHLGLPNQQLRSALLN